MILFHHLKKGRSWRIAIEKPQLPTLPKLNYGEGTFAYTDNGAIAYKKYIRLSDGSTIRKTVNSPTVIGCIERMHKVEEDIKRTGCHKGPSDTLKTELNYWLINVKKNQVKTQSYNRLETTIRTIINPWETVNKKACLVRPQELQEFINGMNDGDHSHSTIKKVFDCLNEFYRYLSRRDHFNNPMETVVCVSKNNVVKERKGKELNTLIQRISGNSKPRLLPHGNQPGIRGIVMDMCW